MSKDYGYRETGHLGKKPLSRNIDAYLLLEDMVEVGLEPPFTIKEINKYSESIGKPIMVGSTYSLISWLKDLETLGLLELDLDEDGALLVNPRPSGLSSFDSNVFSKNYLNNRFSSTPISSGSPTHMVLKYISTIGSTRGIVSATGLASTGIASPLTKLVNSGLIESLGKGRYIITSKGEDTLQELEVLR
jgi:hypothetical protein